MNELINIISPYLFTLGILSVGLWFYLCNKLFKTLKLKYPQKYEEIGKPSLIMNNSIGNNILFLKFILKNEYKVLQDSSLNSLCGFMKIFFIVYTSVFLAWLAFFILAIRTQK